ncbi:hypothetical protein PLICRDRAFT_172409 [Plicaturopsis crispa FD-325 SS-3]|nr:hypothetical protein PLICRDRAFT_172409 [Plicaturopsis crispa FD-325 SS-3]
MSHRPATASEHWTADDLESHKLIKMPAAKTVVKGTPHSDINEDDRAEFRNLVNAEKTAEDIKLFNETDGRRVACKNCVSLRKRCEIFPSRLLCKNCTSRKTGCSRIGSFLEWRIKRGMNRSPSLSALGGFSRYEYFLSDYLAEKAARQKSDKTLEDDQQAPINPDGPRDDDKSPKKRKLTHNIVFEPSPDKSTLPTLKIKLFKGAHPNQAEPVEKSSPVHKDQPVIEESSAPETTVRKSQTAATPVQVVHSVQPAAGAHSAPTVETGPTVAPHTPDRDEDRCQKAKQDSHVLDSGPLARKRKRHVDGAAELVSVTPTQSPIKIGPPKGVAKEGASTISRSRVAAESSKLIEELRQRERLSTERANALDQLNIDLNIHSVSVTSQLEAANIEIARLQRRLEEQEQTFQQALDTSNKLCADADLARSTSATDLSLLRISHDDLVKSSSTAHAKHLDTERELRDQLALETQLRVGLESQLGVAPVASTRTDEPAVDPRALTAALARIQELEASMSRHHHAEQPEVNPASNTSSSSDNGPITQERARALQLANTALRGELALLRRRAEEGDQQRLNLVEEALTAREEARANIELKESQLEVAERRIKKTKSTIADLEAMVVRFNPPRPTNPKSCVDKGTQADGQQDDHDAGVTPPVVDTNAVNEVVRLSEEVAQYARIVAYERARNRDLQLLHHRTEVTMGQMRDVALGPIATDEDGNVLPASTIVRSAEVLRVQADVQDLMSEDVQEDHTECSRIISEASTNFSACNEHVKDLMHYMHNKQEHTTRMKILADRLQTLSSKFLRHSMNIGGLEGWGPEDLYKKPDSA